MSAGGAAADRRASCAPHSCPSLIAAKATSRKIPFSYFTTMAAIRLTELWGKTSCKEARAWDGLSCSDRSRPQVLARLSDVARSLPHWPCSQFHACPHSADQLPMGGLQYLCRGLRQHQQIWRQPDTQLDQKHSRVLEELQSLENKGVSRCVTAESVPQGTP